MIEDEIKILIDAASRIGRKDRDNSKFHPSEIGGCSRKIWYNMMGVKGEDFSPRTCRIFDNGHFVHERFNRMFEKLGILEWEEKKVSDDLFSGHADASIKVAGNSVLVDYKSIGSYGFKLLKEGSEFLKEEYKAQLTVYMGLLHKSNCYFIFENKDNQDVLVKELVFNMDYFNSLRAKASKIREDMSTNKLPDRDFDITTSWVCKYCKYKSLCEVNQKK